MKILQPLTEADEKMKDHAEKRGKYVADDKTTRKTE